MVTIKTTLVSPKLKIYVSMLLKLITKLLFLIFMIITQETDAITTELEILLLLLMKCGSQT